MKYGWRPLNPFKGFTLRSESFEEMKGVGDQTIVSWSALLRHHPVPIRRRRHHEKNLCKESRGPKGPTVVPFEILHSEWPLASFEHFGLERPFNMAAIIVFTPKSPSVGDISHLKHTFMNGLLNHWLKWFIQKQINSGMKHWSVVLTHTNVLLQLWLQLIFVGKM